MVSVVGQTVSHYKILERLGEGTAKIDSVHPCPAVQWLTSCSGGSYDKTNWDSRRNRADYLSGPFADHHRKFGWEDLWVAR